MSGDWCRLYRRAERSKVFKDEGLWKVFSWCLMRANWQDTNVAIKAGRTVLDVAIKRGQFVTGRLSASEALHMAPSTVLSRLKRLQSLGAISIFSDTNHTVITVCNYDFYNPYQNESRQRVDNESTQKRNTTLDLKGNLTPSLYSVPVGGESEFATPEERRAAAIIVPIPDRLSAPEFETAWKRWRSHLAVLMRGGLSFEKLKMDMAWCAKHGPELSAKSIDFTISKGNWRELSLPETHGRGAVPASPVKSAGSAAEQKARLLEEQNRLDAARGAK